MAEPNRSRLSRLQGTSGSGTWFSLTESTPAAEDPAARMMGSRPLSAQEAAGKKKVKVQILVLPLSFSVPQLPHL